MVTKNGHKDRKLFPLVVFCSLFQNCSPVTIIRNMVGLFTSLFTFFTIHTMILPDHHYIVRLVRSLFITLKLYKGFSFFIWKRDHRKNCPTSKHPCYLEAQLQKLSSLLICNVIWFSGPILFHCYILLGELIFHQHAILNAYCKKKQAHPDLKNKL